jgi:3-methyladenine DNA glycosylase Tag
MRKFAEIYDIAASRKGGEAALEALLSRPLREDDVCAKPLEAWLEMATKCIFQAGFNWTVVDKKWPGFETAFHEFDVHRCAMLSDDDLGELVSDTRIIRNGQKIRSVRENAVFLLDLAREHGSPGAFFTAWPKDDYVGLLALLSKRGSRLGGGTGQRFLRWMGVESFVLSSHVIMRLKGEGVVDRDPTSKGDMKLVQAAFNTWKGQSGRSFNEISQVLAYSNG